MAYEIPGQMASFIADVDLSNTTASQFIAVTIAAGANTVGDGIGNPAIKPIGTGTFLGVLQSTCQVGEAGNVMLDGITRWQSAGAFVVGDLITANAQGRAIKATAGAKVLGIALEQAVSGDIATVLLRPNGAVAA